MFLWNMVGALLMMPALARLVVVPAASAYKGIANTVSTRAVVGLPNK